MTLPVRLRRHTDGRLAVFRDGMWLITSVPPVTSYPSWFHDGRLCSGPGWSELLVTALPEPDDVVNGTKVWDLGFGKLTVGGPAEFESSFPYSIDSVYQLRSDALKMLAAVTAWEQYRANYKPEGVTS